MEIHTSETNHTECSDISNQVKFESIEEQNNSQCIVHLLYKNLNTIQNKEIKNIKVLENELNDFIKPNYPHHEFTKIDLSIAELNFMIRENFKKFTKKIYKGKSI